MDHPSWLGRALGALAGLVLFVGVYLGLVLVPPDAVQGQVQRIMYLHVPSIVTAYLAFTVTCVASALYLWKRDLAYDAAAVSSAEIGVVLTGVTLATGCIWGKATWGVWWTWDARLTLTAILFTIYVGYLMLRAFAEEPQAAARYGAVLAILGFLDIPMNHMAVQWWRTLHQRLLDSPSGRAVDGAADVGDPGRELGGAGAALHVSSAEADPAGARPASGRGAPPAARASWVAGDSSRWPTGWRRSPSRDI